MKRLLLCPLVSFVVVALAAPAHAEPRPIRTLPQGKSLFFFVNAPEVDATFTANGATLAVYINGKALGHRFTLEDDGSLQPLTLAWDLPNGPQRFAMVAVSGDLEIWSWSYGNTGGGRMIAGSLPKLDVFGDSIALGRFTGGADNLTGGWADQVAPALQLRVANSGIAAVGAACWAPAHTGRVIGQQPSYAVIVAFGVNDLVAGKDATGCNPTIDEFRQGVDTMLGNLDALTVPVYVSAILPVRSPAESKRADWNEVLADEAAAHGDTYADPSPVLDTSTDYYDKLHPNQQGHDKLAQFWTGVLGA